MCIEGSAQQVGSIGRQAALPGAGEAGTNEYMEHFVGIGLGMVVMHIEHVLS